MSKLLISFPGNEALSEKVRNALDLERAEVIIRKFPDGESYVRLLTNVSNKEVIVVATLDQPDNKFLPLLFLLKLVRDAGAKRLILVSPYLPYMRQDKQFQPGEAVTSTYFAALLSSCIDKLITIDPHLHRRSTMGEIYEVPTVVLHAATLMSEWISNFALSQLYTCPGR
jgi:ribose-phosphate pyrophosphokinase